MSKILTFITILILSTFTMFAEERSEQQMREAAQRAITQNLPDRSRARSAGNDLKELMAMPKLKIYGYDDGGFAVVTSDDRFDEVIGYSSTTFAKEMPCGFKWWLNTVNEVMEKAKGNSPVSAKSRAKIKKASVAPILKTKWGQGNPFNSLLHYNVRGTDVEFVTGCVATAMAQVMKHYEYPDCGRDSITYVIWKYWSNMKHTFGDTFDWANMLDEYTYQIWGYLPPDAKAVATLMRDCGMAVKMQYGPKESGANTEEIAPALINYFQYDKERTRLLERKDYSRTEWLGLIYDELASNRPIIYSGRDKSDADSTKHVGHAFVLHGYDSDGKVYVNWGWKGQYDGYFEIDLLKPDENYYKDEQKMVFVMPGVQTDNKRSLTISVRGYGSIYYNGSNEVEIRNTQKTFNVNKGNNIVLAIKPDAGNILKSLIVNGEDVASKVQNQEYIISNISKSTNVSASFGESQAYTLSITSSGKGVVWYDGNSIRESSKSFKITKGKSAELTFSANYGYYIKSLVVNNEDVTSKIANNSFTISQISSDVNVKIEFAEQIPDGDNDGINAYLKCFVTMQMVNRMNSVFLSKSTFLTLANTHRNAINITKLVAKHPTKGHVLATIEDKSQLGELKGGAEKNVTISYEEDVNPVYEWYYTYQGKSYMKKSEGKDVMTYELTIKATGNGSVGFNNTTLRDGTKRINIDRGKSITLSIEPDKEHLVKSLLVNGADETSKVSNNQYVISEIHENTSVEIVFEKDAAAEAQKFELRKRDLDVWIKSIETIVNTMPKTIDNYDKQYSLLQAHLNVLSAAIGDKLTQSEKSVSSASIPESDKKMMMTRLSEIKRVFDKCQTDANNLYEQIKKDHKSDQDIAADFQEKLNTAKVKLIMASDNDGLDEVELLLKQLEQSVKKGKNGIDNHFSQNSKAFKDVEEALTKTSQSIDEFNKQLEELINSMRSVIAVDCSREYGEENPELTYKTIGQINGVPQLSVLAFKFSPVGEYTIFVLSGTITTKGVNYVNGTMTITKAPLKITPKDIVVKFDDPMPEFELTYEGFKNTDTERVLSTKPVIETEAWSTRVPGRYRIVAYGAQAENYDITYGTGWLTIEEPSGVAPIKNDNDKPFNVYDLNGRLVRHQVTSLEGLHEGVYVIDGKKIRINEVRNEK